MFDVPNIPPSMALCEIVLQGSVSTDHCEVTIIKRDVNVLVEFRTDTTTIKITGVEYNNGFDAVLWSTNDGESLPVAGQCDVLNYQRKVSCRINVGHQVYFKAQW